MFATIRRAVTIRIRAYLSRLFKGEGQNLCRSEGIRELPCNYHSDF